MTEQSDAWQTSWAREADKVKGLAENNAHLRAALVKAEQEVNEANERAHHNHVSRTALLSQLREQRERAERAEKVLAEIRRWLPERGAGHSTPARRAIDAAFAAYDQGVADE